MRAFKILVIAVVALIVLLVVIGFVLPETAHVERSIIIKAKPGVVFAEVNSMHEFNRWSPWSQIDPDAVTTFSGPAAGVGALMNWSGNSSVGTGSQEIVESVPDQRVKTKLIFAGYDHPASATFQLQPVDAGTQVTWMYDTTMGYDILSRYFGMMLDGWIGKDYEKGLVTLAHLVENKQDPSVTEGQLNNSQ